MELDLVTNQIYGKNNYIKNPVHFSIKIAEIISKGKICKYEISKVSFIFHVEREKIFLKLT